MELLGLKLDNLNMPKTPAWTRKEGKDPKGGLNRKGVESYRKANPNSKLKMGVDKAPKTPEEKRRQGSFLVRFYGRAKLPPLKKPNGEPTRFALANTKWNGTVVKTVAQARQLASKGRRLLAQSKK